MLTVKFSILIANYNNGRYFKDCYDSVMAQTYPDWEAIIVDDGSTDDSVTVIKDIIKGDERFHFFENDGNRGCGFTKNRCASLAKGEVLGFLDPDDALTPAAVEEMLAAHSEYPEIVLVHSLFYYCTEHLKKERIYTLAKPVKTDKFFVNFYGEVSAFATFKKRFYDQTEGISTGLKRSVDQDLYLKLAEKGSFFFLNMPLYLYRLHSRGIATANEYEAFYNHLKVLISAEERRGVNFEKQVSDKILSFGNHFFDEKNLNNPRYLFGKLFRLLGNRPVDFVKGLFRI